MRDVLATIQNWRAEGKDVALATVVKIEGSAPRREGARLAVSDAGEMSGSVSGGCVENDVIHHAQKVLASGTPRLLNYAISDDMIWDVGLACGGAVHVWIERLADTTNPQPTPQSQLQIALERALVEEHTIVQAISLDGPTPGEKLLVWPSGETTGSLGSEALDRQVVADALALMARPRAELRAYAKPAAQVFVEVFSPPPHLVILGGVHIAIPLTTIAKTLGYQVTIADPRTQFANRDRFPYADHIIPKWPRKAVEELEITSSTYCVVLTHDPKIDEPALKSLLGKGAGYIGAIGSRKTHTERFERMARLGIDAGQLAEVYAPIGLDLGAETPEEIALAILAEIVAVRRGALGGFLRDKV
jgi:xanthine dehydrogenase accessory factor